MTPLLTMIVTWLAMNFALPANYSHPSIAFIPEAEIYKIRYGDYNTGSGFGEVIAVYDTINETIYLPQNWTAVAPADVSVLVHEMAHHLQKKAGLEYDCGGAREAIAYAAQARWLEQSGTDLEREFGFDRMTIKVLTTCQFH